MLCFEHFPLPIETWAFRKNYWIKTRLKIKVSQIVEPNLWLYPC